LKPEGAEPRSNPAMETPSSGGPSRDTEDEAALVARARARDSGAFRLLVERHRDRAYGLAFRITRSATDAEEVAQDGFVRAWLALPRFRGESSFSTWLYRIIARRAFDRASMLRRRQQRETGIESIAEHEDPGAGSDEAVRRAHRMERLVGELSESQRAVVTLFYYEGRSVDQVAEILAMPQGTVKTHLSRARAALRAAWLKHEKANA